MNTEQASYQKAIRASTCSQCGARIRVGELFVIEEGKPLCWECRRRVAVPIQLGKRVREQTWLEK